MTTQAFGWTMAKPYGGQVRIVVLDHVVFRLSPALSTRTTALVMRCTGPLGAQRKAVRETGQLEDDGYVLDGPVRTAPITNVNPESLAEETLETGIVGLRLRAVLRALDTATVIA